MLLWFKYIKMFEMLVKNVKLMSATNFMHAITWIIFIRFSKILFYSTKNEILQVKFANGAYLWIYDTGFARKYNESVLIESFARKYTESVLIESFARKYTESVLVESFAWKYEWAQRTSVIFTRDKIAITLTTILTFAYLNGLLWKVKRPTHP